MANPNQPDQDQEKESPVDSEKQRREAECMHDVLLLLEHMTQREKVTVELILDRLYDVGATNLIEHKIHSQRLQKTVKPIARMSKPAFRLVAWYWFKQNCPKLITDWLYSKVSFEPEVSTEAKAEIADQEQKEQVLADGAQVAEADDQELSANGARSPVELNELEQQEQVGTATTTSSQTTAPASTVATLETESAEAANSDASSNGDSNKNGQVTKPTVTSSAIVLAPSSRDQNKHNAASQSTPEVERLRQQVRLLTGALVGVICVFSGGVIWLGYQLDLKPNDIFSGQTQTTLIKKHSVSQ
jgi:hypothetical protein